MDSSENNKTNLRETLRANQPDLDSNVPHLCPCDVLWKVGIPIWIIHDLFASSDEGTFFIHLQRCSGAFISRAPGAFVVSLMRSSYRFLILQFSRNSGLFMQCCVCAGRTIRRLLPADDPDACLHNSFASVVCVKNDGSGGSGTK